MMLGRSSTQKKFARIQEWISSLSFQVKRLYRRSGKEERRYQKLYGQVWAVLSGPRLQGEI
jgi:hypothetical protein